MSERERNLEITRRALAAFSRGELEQAAADLHPEVEWHVAFRIPDLPISKDVYRGRAEVLALWRAFRSAWATLTIEIAEFLFVDGSRALFRARFVGRGGESGIEVDRTLFYAYRIEDGLLIYSRAWEDEASARRDLGLDDV